MREEEEPGALERVTAKFIDTLWPASKWANNDARKEVKEFFGREVKAVVQRLESTRGYSISPLEALDHFLSTVVKEAENQFKLDAEK